MTTYLESDYDDTPEELDLTEEVVYFEKPVRNPNRRKWLNFRKFRNFLNAVGLPFAVSDSGIPIVDGEPIVRTSPSRTPSDKSYHGNGKRPLRGFSKSDRQAQRGNRFKMHARKIYLDEAAETLDTLAVED